MGVGDGNELSVRCIEINEVRIIGKTFEAARVVILQTYGIDVYGVDTILQRPFHEGIAGTVSFLGLGLVQILAENPELIVERQLSPPHDVLQLQGASGNACPRNIGMLPIGDQYHVGIDNSDTHVDGPCCLFMAATVRAVKSAISSPKKFSGQFSMSP